MTTSLEQLVDSLLYEGYALYPYTPGATKNATPTPFGIVYPPSYAVLAGSTFDHLAMECVLLADSRARIGAEVRFLQGGGERHKAEPRRVQLEPVVLGELGTRSVQRTFRFEHLAGTVVVSAKSLDQGWRIRLRVENHTPLEGATEAGRMEALTRSFISTHPILRTSSGRFLSPLDARGCQSTNTWPVLVGEHDDSILGAAIVLPDHPAIAPQSRGDLFDNTEIEEALLLHIQALSDAEREEIDRQDPAVKEMIARAQSVGTAEIMDLHGAFAPLSDAAQPPSAVPGESEVIVDDVTFRRGGKVLIRSGDRPNPQDRKDVLDSLLDGKVATIERIYLDPNDRVYLGVTVDDDPGQDLMRDTGRYLFFFTDEVEVLTK
jgi:hypothetical protein